MEKSEVRLPATPDPSEISPKKDLVSVFQAVEDISLSIVADNADSMDDIEIVKLLDFFKNSKKKLFLFKWVIIASRYYRLRKIKYKDGEDICIIEEMCKIFPDYTYMSLSMKTRAWRFFYQDEKEHFKLKWNEKNYFFDHGPASGEKWFTIACQGTTDFRVARQNLLDAEAKYKETLALPDVKTYNPEKMLEDYIRKFVRERAIFPFSRFSGSMTKWVGRIHDFTEHIELDPKYEKVLENIAKDLEAIAAEVSFVHGKKIDEKEVLEKLGNSRIKETGVFLVDRDLV